VHGCGTDESEEKSKEESVHLMRAGERGFDLLAAQSIVSTRQVARLNGKLTICVKGWRTGGLMSAYRCRTRRKA
jgi:hypothetical protein